MRFVDKKTITKFTKINRYLDKAMKRFIDEEKSDLLKTANEIYAEKDLFPTSTQKEMSDLIKNIEADNFDKAIDNCVQINNVYGSDFDKACAKAGELALSIAELDKLMKEEEKQRKQAEKYEKVVERQNKMVQKDRDKKKKEAMKAVKMAEKQIKAYEKQAAQEDKKAATEAKKAEAAEKKVAALQKKVTKEKNEAKKAELEKQLNDLKAVAANAKKTANGWIEAAKGHHKALLEWKEELDKAQKDVEKYSVDIFQRDSALKIIRDCRAIIDKHLKKYRTVRKLDSMIKLAERQDSIRRRNELVKKLNQMID